MVRIADLICGERMARDLEPCRAASVPGTAPPAQLTGRGRTIQTDRFRRRCRPADTSGVQDFDREESKSAATPLLMGRTESLSAVRQSRSLVPDQRPGGGSAKGADMGPCCMGLTARCIAQMSRAGSQGRLCAPHAPPRQPVTGPVPHLGAVCLVHRRARRLDLNHENSRRRERIASVGRLMRGRCGRSAPNGFRKDSLRCAHTHRTYE